MNARIVGPVTTYLTDRTTSLINVFDPGSYKGGGKDSTVKIVGLLLGNQASVDATKWAISKALDLAAQSQRNRTVSKVYLEVDTGNGVWKRTEITGGELRADTQHYDRLTRNHVPFELYISRKPWWEGAEVAIPLGNLNGTNNTTGLNVYNANDFAGTSPNRQCNFADIAAGVIVGDMPTPVKLTAINKTAIRGDSRDDLGWLWIGMGHTNPGTVQASYEAESFVAGTSSGTAITAAGVSGGAYWRYSVPPLAGNAYQSVGGYDLTAAQISAFAGQRVRMILRSIAAMPPAIQIRLRFGNTGWQTDWVSSREGFGLGAHEMFDIRMPPVLEGLPNLGASRLYIDIRNTSTAYTVDLDDFHLIPTDGWCEFQTAVPTNAQVVIDGTEDRAYSADSLGNNRAMLMHYINSGLNLQPGKAHRFYFIQHFNLAYQWDIRQVISVMASYRPRWATL